ncbi:hypothetical protein RKD20_009276 [Streptomyces sp. SLBN-8D4]|jgi:hypothetical protein
MVSGDPRVAFRSGQRTDPARLRRSVARQGVARAVVSGWSEPCSGRTGARLPPRTPVAGALAHEVRGRLLDDLARVLHLNDDQRAYLVNLASKPSPSTIARDERRQVDAQVQRMLDDLTTAPAFVGGRCTDVLARNSLAAAVFTDFAALAEDQRCYIRLLFTGLALPGLYAGWEDVTRLAIAQLLMEATKPATPTSRAWPRWSENSPKATRASAGDGASTTSPPEPKAPRPSTIPSSENSSSTGGTHLRPRPRQDHRHLDGTPGSASRDKLQQLHNTTHSSRRGDQKRAVPGTAGPPLGQVTWRCSESMRSRRTADQAKTGPVARGRTGRPDHSAEAGRRRVWFPNRYDVQPHWRMA